MSSSPPETVRMTDSPRRLPSARDLNDVPSARDLAKDLGSRAHVTEPPPVQSIVPTTRSITSALGLKPGTTPLSPNRTPAPIAIVGGSSLRINSPDRPMSIQPIRPHSAHDFAPPPMPYPAPPSTMKGLAPSVPPSSPASRPVTQPKAFPPPAGGPPASYERAFRQWSSPNITPADDGSSPGNLAAPVTFQVYTAQDIGSGRRPMRSLPEIAVEPKKPNIALRIGMSLLGGLVVLLTAAAVIAVSTEDPKRPAPSATVAPPPPPSIAAPEPPPPTISIGDPDPIDELPSTPAPAATVKKLKPANTVPAAPASLKGMAPPPNPYGK